MRVFSISSAQGALGGERLAGTGAGCRRSFSSQAASSVSAINGAAERAGVGSRRVSLFRAEGE